MALEDAKLSKKDMYALIMDFTSAFNSTDHDSILWIMYDLGFSTDAIEVVKKLSIKPISKCHNPGLPSRQVVPHGGHTDLIPVERGTIQGDILSPFLFHCTWNHLSGGYSHVCLT